MRYPRSERIVRQVNFDAEQWERVQKYAAEKGMPVARFMRFAVMEAIGTDLERQRVGDLIADLDRVTEVPAPKRARAPARAARRALGQ